MCVCGGGFGMLSVNRHVDYMAGSEITGDLHVCERVCVFNTLTDTAKWLVEKPVPIHISTASVQKSMPGIGVL